MEQWDFLCQLEMVGEEGAFVLSWDEVLTEEELSMTLKVGTAKCWRSYTRRSTDQVYCSCAPQHAEWFNQRGDDSL